MPSALIKSDAVDTEPSANAIFKFSEVSETMCESGFVLDLDAAFVEHEFELVNQYLSVYAESFVPV